MFLIKTILIYAQSFFWGIISAGLALVFQVFATIFTGNINLNILSISSIFFLVLIVFLEEIFKYFVILKKIIHLSVNKINTLVLAWLFGTGFSFFELLILIQKNINLNKINLAEIFLLHILTSGIFGYFIITKKSPRKNVLFFAFPFFTHIFYNFASLYINYKVFYLKLSIISFLLLVNFLLFSLLIKKLAQE